MNTELFYFFVALAIGLFIGLERGWHERKQPEGLRIAGIRSFALIALSGCLAGYLQPIVSPFIAPIAFAGMLTIVAVAYWQQTRQGRDAGVTTLFTMIITFLLGLMVSYGEVVNATMIAVVTTLILRFKTSLHAGIAALRGKELTGIIQLALISTVLLPILPNRPLDPWGVLNPYQIWLMVVLIATLSLVGYFAIRMLGAKRGVLITSLFGGLASSTAVTISLARLSRVHTSMPKLCAGAILLSSSIMFPRMLIEVAIVNPVLLNALYTPLLGMMLITLGGAFLLLRQPAPYSPPFEEPSYSGSPFQPVPAIIFGAALAGILLLSHLAIQFAGEEAVILVALLSALTDADAPTLALANMTKSTLSESVAILGILVTAITNTFVKIAYAGLLGSRTLFKTLLPTALLLLLWLLVYVTFSHWV